MSRRITALTAYISSLLTLTMSILLYVEEQGNFHSITPGEAYRSAQLDRDELEYYIQKYKIKSVLNLRGEAADAVWYQEETIVSSEQNVNHYDIALSASKE